MKNKIFSFFVITLVTAFFVSIFSISLGAQKIHAEIDCSAPGSHCLENPLGDGAKTLPDFIRKVLDVVVTIGAPIIALAIIYCGFMFVSARGDANKLTEAKQALLWTLVGAAVLLGSWVLAQALKETVDQIRAAV